MAEEKPVRSEQAAGHTGQPNFAEREFETGSDEFWKAASQNMYNNMKRTYDVYQNIEIEDGRRNRVHVDKVLSDAQLHDNDVRNVAIQALQNAVETANMISKQAVAHRDIAIENQWETAQEGASDILQTRALSIDDSSLKAIGAVVAAAVADALAKSK